jgi:uncharacterized protein (TIGR00270 family)
MYQCELCGEKTDQKIFRTIEGVKMLVCRNCMMMGDKPHSEPKSSTYVQKKPPRFYLDTPDYPPTKKSRQSVQKKKPLQRGPKNVPIDRLKLVDNYRDILRKIRREQNMDQGEFSNSIGITHTSYRHIESGKLDLTIKEAKRIEKKYDVILTEFIDYPEEDEYEQYLRGGKSGSATLGDVYVKRKK